MPSALESDDTGNHVEQIEQPQNAEVVRPKPVSSVPTDVPRAQKNAIFIGHGKDKGPLEQLKRILGEYRLPYRIAEDEANKGRPISQKVAETMRECGAAILIFTADEEFTDKDGNTIYRPSENVVFRIGCSWYPLRC